MNTVSRACWLLPSGLPVMCALGQLMEIMCGTYRLSKRAYVVIDIKIGLQVYRVYVVRYKHKGIKKDNENCWSSVFRNHEAL